MGAGQMESKVKPSDTSSFCMKEQEQKSIKIIQNIKTHAFTICSQRHAHFAEPRTSCDGEDNTSYVIADASCKR